MVHYSYSTKVMWSYHVIKDPVLRVDLCVNVIGDLQQKPSQALYKREHQGVSLLSHSARSWMCTQTFLRKLVLSASASMSLSLSLSNDSGSIRASACTVQPCPSLS